MLSDTAALLRAQLDVASPQAAAQIFVECVNIAQQQDPSDVGLTATEILDCVGPVEIGLIIRALPEISKEKARSQVCERIVKRLKRYNAPPIGPAEMLRLMVATRRASVVRYAFDRWAAMLQPYGPSDDVIIDRSTIGVLADAARAKNRTSAIAASAALLICPEALAHQAMAARRLGHELKAETEQSECILGSRSGSKRRRTAEQDATYRRGTPKKMFVDMLRLASNPDPASRPPAYVYQLTERSGLLKDATDTVITSLRRSMTMEKARLLLTEFPLSWVVTCAVIDAFSIICPYAEHWPTAVGPEASQCALEAICRMVAEATKGSPDRFPWESAASLGILVTYLYEASRDTTDPRPVDDLPAVLKALEGKGQNVDLSPPVLDLPSALRRFRAQRDCAAQLVDTLFAWAAEPKDHLVAKDREDLFEAFSRVAKSDAILQEEAGYYSSTQVYAIGAELVEDLDLPEDRIVDNMCIGSALVAMQLTDAPAYPLRDAFERHVLRSVSARIKSQYPQADIQAVLELLISAHDKTRTVGEFLDSAESLFVR